MFPCISSGSARLKRFSLFHLNYWQVLLLFVNAKKTFAFSTVDIAIYQCTRRSSCSEFQFGTKYFSQSRETSFSQRVLGLGSEGGLGRLMYQLLRGKGNSNLKIICSRCPSAALLKYIQINRMKPYTAVKSKMFHKSELSPIIPDVVV